MKQMLSAFLVFFFFLTPVTQSFAQTKIANAVYKTACQNGTLRYRQYAPNIIKLTFEPAGYPTNEKITDAVILQPSATNAAPMIKIKGDTISIGNAVLTGTHQTNGYRGFDFLLPDGEMIFGGGERALPLNRRGYKFNLYNAPWYGYGQGADNLNFSVPFFTSSQGYGLFFDNGSKGYADIGKTRHTVFETGFVSGELNVYVILGKDYKEILTSYYTLTGTQPLPPRWAMGNFMSRFGYTGETQVKGIAAKMKAAHIPYNAVIFDLFWFGDSIKGTMGNLDWTNKKKWPDPKKMIGGFKKDNINTILITEPFILQHTKSSPFAEGYLAKDSAGKPFMIQDFYFGVGGLLDIFRKDAGNWIWNYHYKKQIANGVAGWWTDLGEPEKHPSAMLHNLKDEGVQRMVKADEIHNLYGHYWNKMLFGHYAKDEPDTRLFHLNRSGFAGSQRYCIFPWSGDVSRSWSGLQAQLPVMLGMSMSGIPYIHADAGGFAGGDGDKELYIRWLQFALFTPVFRPHGTALYDVDPNTFSFPSEPALMDTPYINIARTIVHKRYQMLPYNYTLAYRQAKYGEPLVRPLYYQFPNDTNAVTVQDEFMWGNNILVAPVLEKGATERKVYLPEGKWYDVPDRKLYKGNQWIHYEVDLFKVAEFIKEGSFVPMYPGEENARGTLNSKIEVLYVPSTHRSGYELYEDDGESKNSINRKLYELTSFTSSGLKDNKVIITIRSNNGNYQNKPSKKMYHLIIPLKNRPSKLVMNGKEIKIAEGGMTDINDSRKAVYVNGDKQILVVKTAYAGTPVKLEVSLQ